MNLLENLTYLYSFAILLILSIFDLRTRMVPNYLTLGSYPIFITLLLAIEVQDDASKDGGLVRAAMGALLLFAFFALSRMTRPESIGMGDLKIAPLFGGILAWEAWEGFGIGIAVCFLANGIAALVLLLSRKVDRKTHLPLIPFMLIGYSAVVIPLFI